MYDISSNFGISQKYDIYIERFYENIVFHAVHSIYSKQQELDLSMPNLSASLFKLAKFVFSVKRELSTCYISEIRFCGII